MTFLETIHDAKTFDFARTNGNGASGNLSSSGAGKVITLTPMPPGLAVGGQVRISGGTGTAEVASITAASDVATGPTGTVTVTTAQAHSGAWTIQSATAGMQEAAQSLVASGGGTVVLGSGNANVYGKFTVPTTVPITIEGRGTGTIITVNQTTGTVFEFTGSGVFYAIKDLQIRTAGNTPRNLIAITSGATGTFAATGLQMAGFRVYFNLAGPTNLVYIAGNFLINPFTSGIGVQFATDGTSPGNAVITGNTMSCTAPGDFLAGVFFAGTAISSGIWISENNIFQASYGIFMGPGTGGEVSQVFSIGNAYQSTVLNGIIAAPTGSGFVRVFVSIGDNIEAGQSAGMAFGAFGGVVDSVSVSNAKVVLNGGIGIWLRSGSSNSIISNCTVAQNSQSTPAALPGVLVDAGVSKWQINGGVFGPADGSPVDLNTQSYGIQVAAGASDNYSIVGAYIPVNATGSLSDAGTGTHKVIANNLGIDSGAVPTVASATTITLPASNPPVVYLTGTTTVTTINGGWIGRVIRLIKTDAGTLTVGGGGNVPVAANMIAASAPSRTLVFDGTSWY